MRIIAGRHRGRTVHAPRGRDTRPTSDRVRESLFASLEGMGALEGVRVLDVFAGSGALGLEALSRGAVHAVFVDRASGAVAALKRTVADLGEQARTQVLAQPAQRGLGALAEAGETFGLILLDPPYPLGEEELAGLLAAAAGLLDGLEALIVVERSARSPQPVLPDELEVFRHRTFGETAVWLLQLRE
ncbi:16S rRNA (guanine(966)-N(2))-methyltransferase RsmD [Brevibacterium album]|uniref:16S rRNA (guanine(966)-N(2))-methyltransferase RsmD n=1 Tax=Brevibacterium album TaxID=417948 RepID=UPI000414DA10|nr:16S rRNA (guanine(966)-N(2))-methyltransferase RsmD [Brevibacterium album]